MYKKALSMLAMVNLILVLGFVCVRTAEAARLASQPVKQLRLELAELEKKAAEMEAKAQEAEPADSGYESSGLGIADVAVSGQRVVDYQIVEHNKPLYDMDDTELEVLLRIVEAEAGCEDEEGRLLVANVILNRMNSDLFPGTVKEVVFQQENGVYQFSPIANGSYNRVKVSEGTISAVGRALMGEDVSEGALYFVARKYTDSEKIKWFDNHLTFLFQYGGHEFFK